MKPDKIKVIAIDGQPWGRSVNPIDLDNPPVSRASGYPVKLTIANELDHEAFERYADKHQHPFPGATIGDVIEEDKVDTITLDAKDARLLSQSIGFDHKLMPMSGEFTYYAMKQQPVLKACGHECDCKKESDCAFTKQQPVTINEKCDECGSDSFTLLSDGTKIPFHFYSCSKNPLNIKQQPVSEEPEETANISKLTNSEVGSYHWFATLIGQIKRVGEFLKSENELPPRDVLKSWGENSFRNCNEIIEWWQKQQEGK